MSILVEETYKSRSLTLKQSSREYKISGVVPGDGDSDDGDQQALTALITNVPGVYQGRPLSPQDCSVEETDNGIYIGKAVYQNPDGNPSKQPAGKFSISFDIGSNSKNIKQSWSTRHSYNVDAAHARDFKGAINVDGDHNINGVDINVPVLTINYTQTMATVDVTDAYVQTLRSVVGKTNSAVWKGYAIGSLLLTRVSGQQRDSDNWDIAFAFAYAEGTTISDNYKIDGIGPIEAYGWEYTWAFYEETTENVGTGAYATTYIRRKATNVYVEEVYKLADYDSLGINNSTGGA